MTVRAVHWFDGMFFWPHHMQLADRFHQQQQSRDHQWNLHYNWGVRSLDLDEEALASSRFVVRALAARLRDGTLISVPEDGNLPDLDLATALKAQPSVTVFLAVPKLQPGKANIKEPLESPEGRMAAQEEEGPQIIDPRFVLDTLEVQDENTGENAQLIQVRWLNLKLMLETQTQAGYEVLPIARIRRSPSGNGLAEVDRTYIPALLAIEASNPLWIDILQASFDRIGKKLEFLSGEVISRNISFDTRHFGAPRRIRQLQVLNEAIAVLEQVAFVPGQHPLPVYLELCRIVGQLAIFGPERRVPPLPGYDHDDLGGCFYRVKQYLDALLDDIGEPSFVERPFKGEELRMQVGLEPAWLRPVWKMYVGVLSDLKPEETVRLLSPGQLDMKIGSAERVGEIFARGERGLQFTHTPQVPQALPSLPGLIYFQINRTAQQSEWQNVEKSLTLAIRLNQNRIAGDIHGQHYLMIKKTERDTVRMQFTLYLVAEEPQAGVRGS